MSTARRFARELGAILGLVIVLVLALPSILAGCTTAANISSTNPGVLHDYLFSVEPRNNGSYTIWVRNDDIGAYCTADKKIGEAAKAASLMELDDIPVIMEYRYRQEGDVEKNSYDAGGCYSENSTKYSGVTVYKVLSFRWVSHDTAKPAVYNIRPSEVFVNFFKSFEHKPST